jgi:hypothetical protein
MLILVETQCVGTLAGNRARNIEQICRGTAGNLCENQADPARGNGFEASESRPALRCFLA